MDPLSAIAGALIAGATAAASGVGSDALRDAYQALKRVLIDGYEFASAKLLEKKPTNQAYQAAVHDELKENPDIVSDQAVLENVKLVQDALSGTPPAQLAAWGVDIDELIAAGDVIAERIGGTGGGLKARKVQSGGSVRLTDIKGGSSTN